MIKDFVNAYIEKKDELAAVLTLDDKRI